MRIFTTHTRRTEPPVLVREGFTGWGFLLGWIWLASQRAWIPAALTLALAVLNTVLLHGAARTVVGLGLALLVGVLGRDLVRWSLARRGFAAGPAVAGRTADDALLRLLTAPGLQNAR